jgi:hypothetical protein
MKKLNYLFFLFLVITSCGGSSNDNSTPEALAETIINSLINDDLTYINEYSFKSESELKEFYKGFYPDYDDDRIQRRINPALERINIITESFKYLKEAFESRGVTDWSEIEFVNVDYSDVTQNGQGLIRDVTINFAWNNYNGSISIENIGKIERGWLIMTPPEFGGYSNN